MWKVWAGAGGENWVSGYIKAWNANVLPTACDNNPRIVQTPSEKPAQLTGTLARVRPVHPKKCEWSGLSRVQRPLSLFCRRQFPGKAAWAGGGQEEIIETKPSRTQDLHRGTPRRTSLWLSVGVHCTAPGQTWRRGSGSWEQSWSCKYCYPPGPICGPRCLSVCTTCCDGMVFIDLLVKQIDRTCR